MEKLTTKKVYRAHREQKIANWALIAFVLSNLWLIICSGFSLLLIIQFLLFTPVLFFVHRRVTRSIWRELFRKKRSLSRMRTQLHLKRLAAMLNNSEPKDQIIKRHNNMAKINELTGKTSSLAKQDFLPSMRRDRRHGNDKPKVNNRKFTCGRLIQAVPIFKEVTTKTYFGKKVEKVLIKMKYIRHIPEDWNKGLSLIAEQRFNYRRNKAKQTV